MPVDRMLVARVLVLAAGLGLAGCRTTNPTTVYPLLSYADTEQRLLRAPDIVAAPDIDVLALTPEIEAWIATEFANKSTSQLRLHFLTDMFAPNGALNLTYE